MLLEEPFILFLKSNFLMLFLLVLNVSDSAIELGGTYGENAVSLLPRKILDAESALYPSRRVRLGMFIMSATAGFVRSCKTTCT